MKKSRHTEEQIAYALRQADGQRVRRIVQRTAAQGMLECELIPEIGRCSSQD